MTDIFESIKLALWNAGLSTTPVANKYYMWLPYLRVLFSFLFVPPSIDYVLRYQPDLNKITQAFYLICGSLILTDLRFCIIWSHMDTLKEIFDSFQQIVNASESYPVFLFSNTLFVSVQRNITVVSSSVWGSEEIIGIFRESHLDGTSLYVLATIAAPTIKLISLAFGTNPSATWELPFKIRSVGTIRSIVIKRALF